MDKIPHNLIRSLMELGLLESEARIYIALAMMNNSEVKNIIDFLGLSKPNTYESLRLLEEKGLVVLINTKPMTYQATPPDIGLEMLLETHLNAEREARNFFHHWIVMNSQRNPRKHYGMFLGEKVSTTRLRT